MTRQLDPRHPLTSTYRLHLTHAFTLDDAAALVPHLADLGVGWVYLSPVQRVPGGADHGYHVLDHDVVDPQLGGRTALDRLAAVAHERGMGVLLDIVPNHMGATPENPWWDDLLAHGADSVHATTFDVDTGEPGQPRPVVLPVLDAPLQQVIDAGRLVVDAGRLVLDGGLALPLSPDTPVDAAIADVLAAQHYVLLPWQQGEQVLNWRRFFAVNELAGVRVEDQRVFDAVHRLVIELVEDGVVDGLRIDHVDGLADPEAYLRTLRQRVGDDVWLLVEKIAEHDEVLPAWPSDGTTGYEVAALLGSWLTDAEGLGRLQQAFTARTGLGEGPTSQALVRSKRHVLTRQFTGEVATIRRLLDLGDPTDPADTGLSDTDPADTDPADIDPALVDLADIDPADIDLALVDLLAEQSGYRTYAPLAGPVPDADTAVLRTAAAAARSPEIATAVVDRLLTDDGRPALLRFQQLAGPAAAKGFEDRLLYRRVALSSLCEVGVDPHLLDAPLDPAIVVGSLDRRQREWPAAGTTTSTHDTKRSEDVRARITALAEIPDTFTALLDDLAALDGAPEVHAHTAWLLAQTVLGTQGWGRDDADLPDRLQAYASKALREAEVTTAHRGIDAEAEAAAARWLTWLLTDPAALAALAPVAAKIAIPGAVTALTQVVLKVGGPGVPDVYRGTEAWDDSLVDPDNRRPLDVAGLTAAMDAARTVSTVDDVTGLRDRWQERPLKLHVTRRSLLARRDDPDLFLHGRVERPTAAGSAADHVAALTRHLDGRTAVALGTRLPVGLAGPDWPVGAVWGDTTLEVGDAPLRDVLTDVVHTPSDGRLRMAEVCAVLGVAMLVGHDHDRSS